MLRRRPELVRQLQFVSWSRQGGGLVAAWRPVPGPVAGRRSLGRRARCDGFAVQSRKMGSDCAIHRGRVAGLARRRAGPDAEPVADDVRAFKPDAAGDLVQSSGLSVVISAHDHDRAARVVRALLADGADQGVSESPVPPAPDYEQVRVG